MHMVAPNDLVAELWKLKFPKSVISVGKYQVNYDAEATAKIQSEIDELKEAQQ